MVAINGRVANHVHFLYRIGSCKSPFTICINISGSKRSNRVARFTQRACAWSEPFSRRNESQDFAIFNFILFSKVGVELVHNRIVRKKLWIELIVGDNWLIKFHFVSIEYELNRRWICVRTKSGKGVFQATRLFNENTELSNWESL